jgi:putative metallohydrolase (TIGR04338 family)
VTVTAEPRTDRRHQECLYRAQELAGLHDIARRNYADIRCLEARLTEVMDDDWWIDRYLDVPRPALARLRKGSKWGGIAAADGIWIRTLDDATLLHELSHWVTDSPGHGPEFAETFLAMVRRYMGFHAYGALRTGLIEAGYWAI